MASIDKPENRTTNLDDLVHPFRANWGLGGKGYYGLTIASLDDNGVVSDLSRGQVEFLFPTPPKGIDKDEPPAVVIQPTQGGQFIEHQGSIYKNIQITGTTGLRPNKKIVTIFPGFSVPDPRTIMDEETQLPRGERTGFDDLIDLKNLFRTYYALKQDPATAAWTVLIWQDAKEGEFYIVEPVGNGLHTSREAGSPFTTNYTIALRTTGLYVNLLKKIDDPFAKINSFALGFKKLQSQVRVVSNSINILRTATAVLSSVAVQLVSGVLQPLNDIVVSAAGVLSNVNRGIPATLNVFRGQLSQVQNSLKDVKAQSDAIADQLSDHSSISQMRTVSKAVADAIRAINGMYAGITAFQTSHAEVLNRKTKAYTNEITGDPITGGDRAFIGNAPRVASVGEALINEGDTIRSVAHRLLGNASRWKEIVVLNNLSPPYISSNGDGHYVLRPKDRVLFPSAASNPSPATAVASSGTQIKNQGGLLERLGRDIKLVKKSNGLYTLSMSQKDIEIIAGTDLMTQSIHLKFDIEQGELPAHPLFGNPIEPGSKVFQKSVIQFDLAIRGTLLTDRRITSVDSLKSKANGNVVNVTANISVLGADDSLPTLFNLRG